MHFLIATQKKKIYILHFHVNPLCREKVQKEEAENVQTLKKQFIILTPVSLPKIYCPKRQKHQLCSPSIAWGYGVLMNISLNQSEKCICQFKCTKKRIICYKTERSVCVFLVNIYATHQVILKTFQCPSLPPSKKRNPTLKFPLIYSKTIQYGLV